MSNGNVRTEVRLRRIVTGGQTGVDRAALDVALELGYEIGGWCPAGRRAEDGPISTRYSLQETPSSEYTQRTKWNVRDSDATLVLVRRESMGGTRLTIEEARRRGKPVLVTDARKFDAVAVRTWLQKEEVRILNIAGPRESEEGGIYDEAGRILRSLLSRNPGSTGSARRCRRRADDAWHRRS